MWQLQSYIHAKFLLTDEINFKFYLNVFFIEESH